MSVSRNVLYFLSDIPQHGGFWFGCYNTEHFQSVTFVRCGHLHTTDDAAIPCSVWGHNGRNHQVDVWYFAACFFFFCEQEKTTPSDFFCCPLFFSRVVSRMTPTFKTKLLEFDLLGEGNLPSVCVVRPALKNNRGNPMLQFRRVLIGRRHTLPLVLLNDGTVPAHVRHITLFFYFFLSTLCW